MSLYLALLMQLSFLPTSATAALYPAKKILIYIEEIFSLPRYQEPGSEERRMKQGVVLDVPRGDGHGDLIGIQS